RRVRAVGANLHGEGDAGANGCDTESGRLHRLSVEGARADRGDGGAGGLSEDNVETPREGVCPVVLQPSHAAGEYSCVVAVRRIPSELTCVRLLTRPRLRIGR